MGFRFHRSIKVLPGIRINLGKRGISTSIGVRGAHVTFGQSGRRTTVGIPGTGVSYTHLQGHAQGIAQRAEAPRPAVRSGFGLLLAAALVITVFLKWWLDSH